MPEVSPRNVLLGFITRRAATPNEQAEAFAALAALRDPPSEPPGAGWTTPDPKARRRHG